MILLIDNYDSFVHNLARYLSELGVPHKTVRNDEKTALELIGAKPDAIILSPGPCTPKEAGISIDLTRLAATHTVPLLGVCLGHQTIAEAFGGTTERAKQPRHGKTSPIHHKEHPLFSAHPNPFTATRYHSLIANIDAAPELVDLAHATDDGELMALAHAHLPIFGVQFHPESILTTHGHQLLMNFLDLARVPHGDLPKQKECVA
ncbi:MAG: aminodeoxychorismate/anthranilate synthase component II [Parvibaculum sp.]